MLITYERFGAVTLPIYDPSEPIGSFLSRSSYAALPGGGAFRSYGDQQAPRGPRTVRRTGLLLEQSLEALDSAFAALVAKRGRVDRLYGRRANGDVVWTHAELVSVEALREPRSLFRFAEYVALDVDTEFSVFAGPWYGTEHGGENWEWDSDVAWDSGVAWEQRTGEVFTITPGTLNTNVVTNAGNATTRIVTYTITVPGGAGAIAPVGDDPSITIRTVPAEDVSLTSQLDYYGTIADGAELVIDAGSMSITNGGVGDYAHLAFGVSHTIGGWVVLGPGVNSIQTLYTGATNAILTVDFSDSWE